jgi:hypothetical protein
MANACAFGMLDKTILLSLSSEYILHLQVSRLRLPRADIPFLQELSEDVQHSGKHSLFFYPRKQSLWNPDVFLHLSGDHQHIGLENISIF